MRYGIFIGGLLSVLLLPIAHAQTLPAGVIACAAETDPSARLACYDKAVASFAAAVAEGDSPHTVNSSPSVTPRLPTAEAVATPSAPAAIAAAPAPTNSVTPSHFTARIASLDIAPNDVTVHLDNGQVWEQSQPSDTGVNLHVGDSVTVAKQLGSYWLTGPGKNAPSLQVHRKQ